MVKLAILLIASILSGIVGRMGGVGRPFRSWMRDWVIPPVFLSTLHLFLQPAFNKGTLITYLITYALMVIFFSTYWDDLFGYDELGFSGFCVGLSVFPCVWIGLQVYLIFIWAGVLGIIWGCLNRYLPSKVLIWCRDVAEEFLRYASVLITLPILLCK